MSGLTSRQNKPTENEMIELKSSDYFELFGTSTPEKNIEAIKEYNQSEPFFQRIRYRARRAKSGHLIGVVAYREQMPEKVTAWLEFAAARKAYRDAA